VEWDNQIPQLGALLAEARKAQALLDAITGQIMRRPIHVA
jgi:uncharacterized protein (UPF0276 family)